MSVRLAASLGSEVKSLISSCEEISENLSRGVEELARELGTEPNSVLQPEAYTRLAEQARDLALEDARLEMKISLAGKQMAKVLNEVDAKRARGECSAFEISASELVAQIEERLADAMEGAEAEAAESKRFKVAMKHMEGKGEQEEDVMCLAEDNAVSLICPLTNAKFTQPVQSKKCNHTYESEAILRHLNISKGSPPCPVAGCQHNVTRYDLVPDKEMERRDISRAWRFREKSRLGEHSGQICSAMGLEKRVAWSN